MTGIYVGVCVEELGISQMTGTHLVTVCQPAYNQALALGLHPGRVSLILNGVDTHTFHPRASGEGFRSEMRMPLDTPLVGCVGRVSWEKGPDQFVLMATQVHERRPDVHFALIGDGPMMDQVRKMVRNAALDDVFHFCGLYETMEKVYPALDVQVISSRVEGTPFALLEGMACGRPVAAMSVGGVSEIIEVLTTGLTSAPEDWHGLAEAVLWLLDHPEKARGMGAAGRKRVEARFSLGHSLQSMADLFRSLVKQRSTVFQGWEHAEEKPGTELALKPNVDIVHRD